MQQFVFAIVGFALGAVGYWLFASSEKRHLIDTIRHLQERLGDERGKTELLQNLVKEAKESFKGMSLEALKQSTETFLHLANSTFERAAAKNESSWEKKTETELKPIREALDRCNREVADLEKSRVGAYAALKEQVGTLIESQRFLRTETQQLVRALRTPQVRGRWGELQLKRVVELAGMVAHCDFFEQVSEAQAGNRVRPDLIVRLPGDRNVVVDAKVPLNAYLEAIESTDEAVRITKMRDHARLLKNHIMALSKKNYSDYFQPTPEFVLLFVPGESLLSAALEQDPTLLEIGVEANVIVATPMTLIASLKAVAYGWKQEKISKNAEEIAALGRELYKRLTDMTAHFSKLGRTLEGAVEAYNKSLGSLESRVLVAARRFEDLKSVAENRTLEILEPIDKITRRHTEEGVETNLPNSAS